MQEYGEARKGGIGKRHGRSYYRWRPSDPFARVGRISLRLAYEVMKGEVDGDH